MTVQFGPQFFDWAGPENIHTPHIEGIGVSWGVGGWALYEALFEFPEDWVVLEKIPFVGQVCISRTTNSTFRVWFNFLHTQGSLSESLCCSRKNPYPSHGRIFNLNPAPHPSRNSIPVSYFHSKNWAFELPRSPLEFPATFHGVGRDISWNYTHWLSYN